MQLILAIIEGAAAQDAFALGVGVLAPILGRIGIGFLEAGGPLPDVAGHIQHAIRAGAIGIAADRDGVAYLLVEVSQLVSGWLIAPREDARIGTAAGFLPFG